MKRLIVVVFLVVACGGPPEDVAGTYYGAVSAKGSCSDGSGGTASAVLTWVVAQNGSDALLTTGGSCGSIPAHVSGNVVSLVPGKCPPVTANGTTFSARLAFGEMVVSPSEARVKFDMTVDTSGAAGAGSCTSNSTGIMARQK